MYIDIYRTRCMQIYLAVKNERQLALVILNENFLLKCQRPPRKAALKCRSAGLNRARVKWHGEGGAGGVRQVGDSLNCLRVPGHIIRALPLPWRHFKIGA